MTHRLDELNSLARRVQTTKEVSDELVLDVTRACVTSESEKIPGLYELVEYCEIGAWIEAAFWVFRRALPTWTLHLSEGPSSSCVTATSEHAPPLTVERRRSAIELSILDAVVQAVLVLERVGLRRRS